jgi:D-xylose reductase
VKKLAKLQLDLWGIEQFDLFLIHFPVSLQYVDPNHRYPPEWFGDDGKVHLGTCSRKNNNLRILTKRRFCSLDKIPMQETWQAMEELVDEGIAKNIGLRFVFQFRAASSLLNYLP